MISGCSFHQSSDSLGIAMACDALLGILLPESLLSILTPGTSTISPLITNGYFTKKLSCLMQLLSIASQCNQDPIGGELPSDALIQRSQNVFPYRIEQYLVKDESVARIALE